MFRVVKQSGCTPVIRPDHELAGGLGTVGAPLRRSMPFHDRERDIRYRTTVQPKIER
jgi:hypothetical protein